MVANLSTVVMIACLSFVGGIVFSTLIVILYKLYHCLNHIGETLVKIYNSEDKEPQGIPYVMTVNPQSHAISDDVRRAIAAQLAASSTKQPGEKADSGGTYI